MRYLKTFNESTFEDDDNWDDMKEDEIDGSWCVDFETKDLKVGDKIFKQQVSVYDYEYNWAKDENKLEVKDKVGDYPDISEYTVKKIEVYAKKEDEIVGKIVLTAYK